VLLAPINILEKSRFRERKDGFGHDQVIKNPDVDQRQSFSESSCDQLICCARLRESRRVVVKNHQSSRVAGQRRLDDLPRMNRCAGNRPPEKIFDRNEAMPAIQV
jgi:hypothetical protein